MKKTTDELVTKTKRLLIGYAALSVLAWFTCIASIVYGHNLKMGINLFLLTVYNLCMIILQWNMLGKIMERLNKGKGNKFN